MRNYLRLGHASSRLVASAFAAFLLSLATSGCGNRYGTVIPGTAKISQASLSAYNGSSASSRMVGQYACPDAPQVLPDYDAYLNGSGRYQVCTDASDASTILLLGKSDYSEICVFPAEAVNSQAIVTKPDLATGLPLFACAPIGNAGAAFKFEGVSYNAVFVVDSPLKNAMQACLAIGNYFTCPLYSFGRFK